MFSCIYTYYYLYANYNEIRLHVHVPKQSVKTGQFSELHIVVGSLDFWPIRKSAEKSAKIKFVSDQQSAEKFFEATNSIRTVHKVLASGIYLFLVYFSMGKNIKIIAHHACCWINDNNK